MSYSVRTLTFPVWAERCTPPWLLSWWDIKVTSSLILRHSRFVELFYVLQKELFPHNEILSYNRDFNLVILKQLTVWMETSLIYSELDIYE